MRITPFCQAYLVYLKISLKLPVSPTTNEVEKVWKGSYEKPPLFADTPVPALFRQLKEAFLQHLADCPPFSVGEVKRVLKGRKTLLPSALTVCAPLDGKPSFPLVHRYLARVSTSLPGSARRWIDSQVWRYQPITKL